MIVREFYKTRADGVNLFRTYSNKNFMIKKVGTNEKYSKAIDVEDTLYTYEETSEHIIDREGRKEITAEEFLDMVEDIMQQCLRIYVFITHWI